jgi:hypothetical protein
MQEVVMPNQQTFSAPVPLALLWQFMCESKMGIGHVEEMKLRASELGNVDMVTMKEVSYIIGDPVEEANFFACHIMVGEHIHIPHQPVWES